MAVQAYRRTNHKFSFNAAIAYLPKRAQRVLLMALLFSLTLLFVGMSNKSRFLKTPYLLQYLRRQSLNDTSQWAEHRTRVKTALDTDESRAAFDQIPFAEESFFEPSSNLLGTLNFAPVHQFQRQPYVSNGYIGARVPNLGHGFAVDSFPGNDSSSNTVNGWPLFDHRFAGAFVAGFYDLQHNTTETNFPWLLQYGGESVISAVPQWTFLGLSSNGKTLDPRLSQDEWGQIDKYSQTLSLENGKVTTQFLWQSSLYILYVLTANRAHSSVGTVSLTVTNPTDQEVDVEVTDELDFDTSRRLELVKQMQDGKGIAQIYSPMGVSDVFGATYSTLYYSHDLNTSSEMNQTDSKVYQTVKVKIPPNSEVVIDKVVGIVTSDLNPVAYDSSDKVLNEAKSMCLSHGYGELDTLNDSEWQHLLGASLAILFPDDTLLTMASRASIYHLLANTRADAQGVTAALGVTGLSSDSYGGMVFWDTDLWMLSALLPYAPEHSQSLVNYRFYTHNQAKQNLMSPLNTLGIESGAAYPWTSGRFGNCTATGPCFDYEYHLNSAIVLSAWKLYLSGVVDDDYLANVAFPVISDAALFFSQYVKYNDTLQQYTTKNLTDPDEYANHIDNGAYTNAAIVSTLNIAQAIYSHLGMKQPDSFAKIAGAMYIPRSSDDDNIVLEYSGMPASVEVKQADVVMLTYPLEYGLDETVAEENMRYYSMKQASFGPAMTWPIFSAVSSIVLEAGCSSQSYLVKAAKPFLRGPFAQFLEQNNDDYDTNGGTHPAFPFLTASGGFLQAVHGLFGLKFDYEVLNNTVNRFLRVDAAQLSNLPNGVFLDGLRYMNLSLALNLTDNGLEVINRGQIKGGNASSTTLHVKLGPRLGSHDYYIESGSSATLPIYTLKANLQDSLTECRKSIFANITQGVAGDVLALINDGDNSTYWQAETANTSKILVDLLYNKTIKGGSINWGEMPPKSVSVYAPNQEFNSHVPSFDLIRSVLNGVSFDGHDSKGLSETDAFSKIFSTDVTISEPFNDEDYQKVILQNEYNTTTFSLPEAQDARFVLVEFEGLLSPSESGGARIYDLNFT